MSAFSGDPSAVWINEAGTDRRMKLLEDFWFDDPDGRRWLAPKDSTVDGASIPRALWALVGSPYTGDYRRASIVHDIACDQAGGDATARRAADRMFYHACRAGGCSVREATLLYTGVRLGAHWGELAIGTEALGPDTSRPRLRQTLGEKRLEADYQLTAEIVLAPGEVDDIDVIERRADEALAVVTNVKPN